MDTNIDRSKLDWKLTSAFSCVVGLPERYQRVSDIIKEVDVLWLKRGSSELTAMFEVNIRHQFILVFYVLMISPC